MLEAAKLFELQELIGPPELPPTRAEAEAAWETLLALREKLRGKKIYYMNPGGDMWQLEATISDIYRAHNSFIAIEIRDARVAPEGEDVKVVWEPYEAPFIYLDTSSEEQCPDIGEHSIILPPLVPWWANIDEHLHIGFVSLCMKQNGNRRHQGRS